VVGDRALRSVHEPVARNSYRMSVTDGIQPSEQFTGVILAGGFSTRMGRDKAFICLDGRPLVQIAGEALRAAGMERVIVVGGDHAKLRDLGLEFVEDQFPGEGPLGAIITALRASKSDNIMVLACDMPAIDGATVSAISTSLLGDPDAHVAAAFVGGRRQVLTAAYRQTSRGALETNFAAGVRAPRHALEQSGLNVIDVDGLSIERLVDVDNPQDLNRYDRPKASQEGSK